MHQFRKHYYPDVGDLKTEGEEHECAQTIDSLAEVTTWVCNNAGAGLRACPGFSRLLARKASSSRAGGRGTQQHGSP